jgi:hypothetical protein
MGYSATFSLALGVLIYLVLSSLPKIELFKLFNVAGLAFDILGVLLLSKLIVKSAETHIVLLDYFYDFIFVAVFCVPIGVISGEMLFALSDGMLFALIDLPSSRTVVISAGLILTIIAPLLIAEFSGVIFELNFYKSVRSRIIFIGWYLLFAGLLLQMTGAIMDLMT